MFNTLYFQICCHYLSQIYWLCITNFTFNYAAITDLYQLTNLRCFNLLILLYCWSLRTKILKSNQLQMHVKNSSGLASGPGNGCAFLLCLLCHGLITVWKSSICLNIKWIAQVKIFVLLSAWKCHCGEGKATLKRKIKEHKCHSVYSGLRSSRAWRAGMFAWLDDYPVLWIMSNVTHLALPFADLWGLFEHLHALRSICVDTLNSLCRRVRYEEQI